MLRIVVLFMVLAAALGLVAMGQIDPSDDLVLGLVAGLAAYVITFANIKIGIALLIVSVGLSPEFDFAGKGLRLEDLLLPGILLAWLTKSLERREEFEASLLKWPIVVLLFLAAVSSLFHVGAGEVPGARSLFYYLKTVEYFLLYVIVLNNVKNMRDFRALVTTMLFASALVGLYFSWLAIKGQLGAAGRLHGPPGETANIFGGYLAFNILLAIGMLTSRARSAYQFLLLGLIALLLLPLLFTLSRTSYVSLVVAILIVGIVRRRGRLLLALAAGLVVAMFALPEKVEQRAETIAGVVTGEAPSSWAGRVATWHRHFGSILDSPLIGKGVGTAQPGQFDNEYVKVATETGLPGFLAFLWMMTRVLKMSLGVVREGRTAFVRAYAVGFFGAAVALFVHSLAAPTLTAIRSAEVFWIGAALMTVAYNRTVLAPWPDAEFYAEDGPEEIPAPRISDTARPARAEI